jgi:hypothetical protein
MLPDDAWIGAPRYPSPGARKSGNPLRLVSAAVVLLAVATGCEPSTQAAALRDPERSVSSGAVASSPECRAIQVEDPVATTVTFRTALGACVPPGHLLAYHCGPHRDPVATLGIRSDSPRTYIGGRYSVPVHELPFEARLVGVANGTRVFAVHDDPRWLWVQEEETLSRWLALAEDVRSTPPDAFLIGDSILLGAQAQMTAMLPGWTLAFDAKVGRGSLGALPVVAAQAALPHDVVVVQLGTNDADPLAFRSNVQSMVDALAGVRIIVLVNIHSPSEAAEEVNRAIRRVAASVPNAVVADWDAGVPPHAVSTDGVHLKPDRLGAFANFLAPVLLGWHASARGNGARHCASAVETAVLGRAA